MLEFLSDLISREDTEEAASEMLLHLYLHHYRLWHYKIFQILRTYDTGDIIHDVFLNLMSSHLETLQKMPDYMQLGYISKAMTNAALKQAAEQGKLIISDDMEPYLMDEAAEDPAVIYDKKVDYEIFQRAFGRLPNRMQDLLFYKFYEELPDETIAMLLGIQPASLRSALHRARIALKREIERETRK